MLVVYVGNTCLVCGITVQVSCTVVSKVYGLYPLSSWYSGLYPWNTIIPHSLGYSTSTHTP